jgi:hypothetical protein
MTQPSSTRTVLKRGDYAKDTRTGQVVIVKEHGRGGDVMVRPAYKSDGYWLGRTDLVPAKDPHAWTGKHLFVLLLLVLAASGLGWHATYELTRSGASLWTAITDGGVPTGLLALIFFLGVTRIART